MSQIDMFGGETPLDELAWGPVTRMLAAAERDLDHKLWPDEAGALVSEQLDLLPAHDPARRPRLTDRQQHALDAIRQAEGGLADDELGAVDHERQGKHGRGQRCDWCAQTGAGLGRELRAKGYVVKRRATRSWQAVEQQARPAPQGLGDLPEGF